MGAASRVPTAGSRTSHLRPNAVTLASLFFSALTLFGIAFLSVSIPAVASVDEVADRWAARQGTVAWMYTQPVGTVVTLDAMIVDEVGSYYIIVREPCDARQLVAVQAAARVKKWQSVEVTGTIAVDSESYIYLADARVKAYTDSKGDLIPICPKHWSWFTDWANTVDVTVEPDDLATCGIASFPGPPVGSGGGGAEPMSASADDGSIAGAKLTADGVALTEPVPGVVTAVFDGHFYMEQADRAAGIRVNALCPGLIGSIVSASGGQMMTEPEGERVIAGPSLVCDVLTAVPYRPVSPVATNNKSLGGADFYYDPVTGKGQCGVGDGKGLNNIGLLVKTWGAVTAVEQNTNSFYIDDGAGLQDGSGNTGVRVICSNPGALFPTTGDYLSVVGISSIELNQQSDVVPVVHTMLTSDMTPPSTPIVCASDFAAWPVLYATWVSDDPQTGIAAYRYVVTSAAAPPALDDPAWSGWLAPGSRTIVHEDYALASGADYYIHVQTENGSPRLCGRELPGHQSVGVASFRRYAERPGLCARHRRWVHRVGV